MRSFLFVARIAYNALNIWMRSNFPITMHCSVGLPRLKHKW